MKIKKIFFVSLFLSLGTIFADDYTLKKVPKDYIGTYIPVQMEMLVKEYMSYEKALNTIANSHYDILLLQENKCYSQVRFSDGYAVLAKDFEKWSFVTRKDNKFILDENGLSYRKISDKYDDQGYTAYANVVLSIIFKDAIHDKNITINGDTVNIYGKEYKFNLYPSYVDDCGALCLSNCILKIEGLAANLYQIEAVPNTRWDRYRTDKIVQSIPLFYWNDDDFDHIRPYKYKDSKEDLRLLRNLIFAKHGYKFNSPELQKIFSAFDWYEINPDFTEDEFSNFEKNIVSDILDYEKKL